MTDSLHEREHTLYLVFYISAYNPSSPYGLCPQGIYELYFRDKLRISVFGIPFI